MISFLDAAPNLQLTALADLFPDRLEAARQQLKADKGIDVPANRCFTGFDAHQKLIDSGVDIVLSCTPPHFRPMHFAACRQARQALLPREARRRRCGRRPIRLAGDVGESVVEGPGRDDGHASAARAAAHGSAQTAVNDGAIGDILSARAFATRARSGIGSGRPAGPTWNT